MAVVANLVSPAFDLLSSIKSDAGSFKSPYMGTSVKKTINVIPENTAESTAVAQVGAVIAEPPGMENSTEIEIPADNGASVNDEGFSTPTKPSVATISEVSAAPGDTTPIHSSTNATTISGAQTATKATSASVTTNPAVSQTAYAPRRPSAGPNQAENNRPNVRSARYNALQKRIVIVTMPKKQQQQVKVEKPPRKLLLL